MALATEKWRAENYDDALADVYAGLNLEPEKLRTRTSLIHRKATIYYDLGLVEEAIKFYKKVIAVDPEFSWPYNNLGLIYKAQDKVKEAEKAFDNAIRLDPDYASPYNGLGNIFVEQKKFEKAEKAYNKAIRLDSNEKIFKRNLDLLHKEMNE